MRWWRRIRHREHLASASGAADAQRRLTEARLLHTQVAGQAERNARLAAEAARLARRNRIADIVYHGLIGGDK